MFFYLISYNFFDKRYTIEILFKYLNTKIFEEKFTCKALRKMYEKLKSSFGKLDPIVVTAFWKLGHS